MDKQFSASSRWIDGDRGLVSRQIYTSDEIFTQEIERIFGKAWLFVAHESEISSPGDFVARTMAAEPVVVIRQEDGSVGVFLNSCRHRGVKVCREDSGNKRRFVCPYHGWVYERDGKLVTTAFDQLFPADFKTSDWGLIEVPRVEIYRGLIFASWNTNAVPLTNYLGDFAWYLDLFIGRTPGGTHVLAPPQRSRVKANWKIAAINFGTDNQHTYTTHVGPFTLQKGPLTRPQMGQAIASSVQVSTKGGHSCSIVTADLGEPFALYQPSMVEHYQKMLAPDQQALASRFVVCVGTIFPNLSFIESNPATDQLHAGKTFIMRLWQPISATETEIFSWCLAERETSEDFKALSLSDGIRKFGPAGTFEQEDVELWTSIAPASKGRIASIYPYNFQTAVPTMNSPVKGFAGPGEAYQPFLAEITQLKFLQHWQLMMEDVR